LLAIVQLAAKFDALDYELVLSKSNDTFPYMISIIDFDQMSSISDLFEKKDIKMIVKKVSWPLDAEPFLPAPSNECFKDFKAGYLDVAKQLDNKEKTDFYTKVANAILDNYVALYID